MTTSELNTKIKILQIAHKLFAEKGKNGVGVREIAKAADVNVAAINYHFGNKDSLYSETILASMTKIKTDIRLLYTDNCGVEDLVERIYEFFITNREDLITGFKLFLNKESSDILFSKEVCDEIGPPGGEVLFKCIQDNFPDSSELDILWVVRTIFTQIVHKSLMICNHNTNLNLKYGMTEDSIKAETIRLTKILIREIQ